MIRTLYQFLIVIVEVASGSKFPGKQAGQPPSTLLIETQTLSARICLEHTDYGQV